ncbi:helix-turn-helix domain-containing protein [Kitasatospora sp. NPDC098663]|uniref:helix-turn-helix domain-containing protein n=1 Tax=Kitasatospora sp. NPDC098663 TaxID=3364096 RepID=UPI003824A10B
MEQSEWTTALATATGAAIRSRRKSLGLSADALGKRCADLGVAINRQVISRMEAGQRELSQGEVLVLARALEMPPVALIVPLDQEPTVHATPTLELPTAEALVWVTGEEPSDAGSQPQAVLLALRRHNRLVRTTMLSTGQAEERRRDAQLADPDDYQRVNEAAKQLEDVAHRDRVDVLAARRQLREMGAFPPPLPPTIAFVDPEDS